MDKLGIQPSLLIAQLFNFGIIMVLLNVLLYKPMLKMLSDRKKKIEEGLNLTEKMKEEEAKLEVKKAAMLASAKKDGILIIEEAKKQARDEAGLVKEEARLEGEEMIAKAKNEIASQKAMMLGDVRSEAVTLATAMTKQLLGDVMTSEMQHTMLKKHIARLEKTV